MLNKYYNTELSRLRKHSLEFAKANPAIAPMLGATSTDPDVEILLQGVAYLNGLTLQKLDDEFPEIAQELAGLLVPQFLRPLPAATMIAFVPKARLAETATIAVGTEIASTPIEGVSCVFRTTAALQVHPLALDEAGFSQTSNGVNTIRLSFSGVELGKADALPENLRLFLADEHETAANLFMLLHHRVRAVRLLDQSGQAVSLSSGLAFPGFDEPLIPYPDNAFPGFCLLQELLFFPQKYLFVEFQNLAKSLGGLRGNRLFIEIELEKNLGFIPEVSLRSFQLNVAPAVNLFNQQAEPINLTHETTEHVVTPDSRQKAHYQIYSIDSVTGMRQGQSQHKHYEPFSSLTFSKDSVQSSFRSSLRPSAIDDRLDTHIAMVYAPDTELTNETLSIKLTCTNRALPEKLKLGDVNRPTNSSPERFSFQNITPITGAVDPPYGEKLLWDVISHTILNILSLKDAENLRALLRLYNSLRTHDHSAKTINERQIDGILELLVRPENRLYRGMNTQGQHVRLLCQESNWGSRGSLYLWGCVLDKFLASYAGINAYTRFELEDKTTGTLFKWPLRQGLKLLL